MNQIEALKAQHAHLEDLFHEISLARDVPARTEILADLAHHLIAHLSLEDQLLRWTAATAPREAGLWEDWERRLPVERVVMLLAAIDPSDATFGAKVASLQDVFEDRIEYEETRLFPKLQQFEPQQVAREIPARRPVAPSPEPRFAMGGTS